MKSRVSSLFLFTAAVSAASPVAAQVRPAAPAKPAAQAPVQQPATPAAKPAVQRSAATAQPGAPVPGNPDYAPQPQVAQPAPPPLPPAVWDVISAQDLLRYIAQVGRDGLNPADYEPERLAAALKTGNIAIISEESTDRFNRLSSDLALGHVKKPGRVGWWVVDNDLDAAKQDGLLRSALSTHQITDALNSLLPTHPQYSALKTALAMTPATETAKLGRIRLNMDRWRWLPRDLGEKYIIVNVPGFHATLVENGVNRWKHRAIAGATKTPTPQLSAMATGVILNPWWEVPPSITKEVAGKKGFVPLVKDGKVQRWRQPPGPTNALGQIKFVMYNPQNIYLHDTNARSRFDSRMRALSHGCIRTEHVLDLATELLGDDGGEWTPDKIQATLDSKKSVQANFVKPVPVYIVYFSSAALLDGKIVDYNDLYGRDAKVMAALQMKDGGLSLGKKPAEQLAGQPAKAKAKPTDQVATR
jgi:murein L,D-transpeptidase YcbB/YkuD